MTWALVKTALPERSLGVHASAPDNVWSVAVFGAYGEASYDIGRWDGTTWTDIPTPTSEHTTWIFEFVVLGPDDVWALGADENWADNYNRTGLAWHWNGTTWTQQEVADGQLQLANAGASANGDIIWAAGGVLEPTGACNGLVPCINHSAVARWDGTEWQSVPLPGDGADLTGAVRSTPYLDVTAGGDAWLVGSRNGYTYLPLLARTFNGAWQYLDTPAELCGEGRRLRLLDVDAEINDDVYVAGTCVQRRANFNEADDDYHTLVAHFDGESWMRV